jgi:methylmalonyl-CoA mutase cobalamin-binding subunit
VDNAVADDAVAGDAVVVVVCGCYKKYNFKFKS